jgi:hypothetical protein
MAELNGRTMAELDQDPNLQRWDDDGGS